MEKTVIRSPGLPDLTNPNVQPTAIATASTVPVRVVVRNLSAALVTVADDANEITGSLAGGGGVFRISPGDEEIFVLAPYGRLYAAAVGTGITVQVSISEALPISARV